jgi:hypothetical protein
MVDWIIRWTTFNSSGRLVPSVLKDFPAFRRTVSLRTEAGQYRKFISNTSEQPFRDTVVFRLEGSDKDKVMYCSNNFLMELVLVTGIPNTKYRKYLGWKMREHSEPL